MEGTLRLQLRAAALAAAAWLPLIEGLCGGIPKGFLIVLPYIVFFKGFSRFFQIFSWFFDIFSMFFLELIVIDFGIDFYINLHFHINLHFFMIICKFMKSNKNH